MFCHSVCGRWILGSLLTALAFVRPLAADDQEKPVDAPAQLTGIIRWKDGRPLAQPDVKLHRWSRDGNRWQSSEKVATVDGEGKFLFENLPGDQYWCVAVQVPEAGLAMRQIATEAGKTAKVGVTLKPAVASYITVRDDQGRPLAGAKFRFWEVIDGTEGEFAVIRGSEAGLGLPVAVSDEAGRLSLPEFPEGVVLERAHIDHPQHAVGIARCEGGLRAGEIATCELPKGFPVRFQFVQPDSASPPTGLSEVRVMMYGNQGSRDANAIVRIPFPVRDGRMEIQTQPWQFEFLRVESAAHFITPQVGASTDEKLKIAAGVNDQWTFRTLPKVLVRGRVVKEDGTPIAKANVLGEIENLLADGSPAPKEWGEWSFTEWGETDANGDYHLHLAPGRGHVSYEGDGMPTVAEMPMMIAGTEEQRVPDFVVRDVLKVRGVVLGLDGQPAGGAIVRLFSKSIRAAVLPVLADAQGRFEFSFPWAPVDRETKELIYAHQVFAYLPYESVGGMTKVDMRDEEGIGNVTVHMSEQPSNWPLSEMQPAFTPWERGEPEEEMKRDRLLPENAVGSAVPELDGALWLNTDQRSLADFQGKFVFLDFYTTWCGPCAFDFPTVKLVYDLYREHGVAVIGVHNNSSAHDVIREHAAEKGMEMPIVVDHEDGRMLKAFEALRLASGYPSYLLLGPDGRLITSDDCTPGPSLRVHKVELVRQLVLQRSSQ